MAAPGSLLAGIGQDYGRSCVSLMYGCSGVKPGPEQDPNLVSRAGDARHGSDPTCRAHELDARRVELQRLSRTSLPWRAVQYLLGCWACQTFWTAVMIYAVTFGVTAPAAWFFSAAAYSGAAVLLSTLHALAPSPRPEATSARGGCKGCGK